MDKNCIMVLISKDNWVKLFFFLDSCVKRASLLIRLVDLILDDNWKEDDEVET